MTLIGPRSGPDACSGSDPAEATVQNAWNYPLLALTPGTHVPLPQSTEGSRTFDFNTDGMAHIGMYPDFVHDLLSIGFTEEDLKPLFNSAEAYLEMWEKAERTEIPTVVLTRNLTVTLDQLSSTNDEKRKIIVHATDSITGVMVNGTVTINSQQGKTGPAIQYAGCVRVDPTNARGESGALPRQRECTWL